MGEILSDIMRKAIIWETRDKPKPDKSDVRDENTNSESRGRDFSRVKARAARKTSR